MLEHILQTRNKTKITHYIASMTESTASSLLATWSVFICFCVNTSYSKWQVSKRVTLNSSSWDRESAAFHNTSRILLRTIVYTAHQKQNLQAPVFKTDHSNMATQVDSMCSIIMTTLNGTHLTGRSKRTINKNSATRIHTQHANSSDCNWKATFLKPEKLIKSFSHSQINTPTGKGIHLILTPVFPWSGKKKQHRFSRYLATSRLAWPRLYWMGECVGNHTACHVLHCTLEHGCTCTCTCRPVCGWSYPQNRHVENWWYCLSGCWMADSCLYHSFEISWREVSPGKEI